MAEKENPQRDENFLAEESLLGADDASALPQRLERYSKAHRRALHMGEYAAHQGEAKIQRQLKACGHWLLFRDYYTAGKTRLYAANFCGRHLLCPLCAIRRGAKLVQAYMAKLQVVLGEQPDLKAYLVTFTVKDGENLSERYNHLTQSMKRYQNARRSYLTDRGPHVEMAKAIGCAGSYEFKRGKNSGLWHPHVHMVWLCREKPDQAKIRREWENVTGDSFMCDVTEFHDQSDVVTGFLEVFKYAVKFSDLPLEDNWHGYEILRRRRMVFSFGALYGVDVPEALTDEALDDLPYVELLFQYTRSGYTFAQRDALKGSQALYTTSSRPPEASGATALERSAARDGRRNPHQPDRRNGLAADG
ncbi:hypothetical protein JHS3_31900 (plasmid) [Jeongeupia sp. HS-3]|uniref:protein rep n=1 Tax=Jeongeupia sp. HS-3 TaxID=1009682 RepID=UPI0018A4DEA2|nr:protein rep [Jeongeupia sp. HS-3]BCL77454.1 hypothetical protein JHS3_31900 [Jeongeupia sp. HS-3]